MLILVPSNKKTLQGITVPNSVFLLYEYKK